MGIDVSATKVVTVNDQHENGVDTSIGGNPTKGKFKGIALVHVFSRNQKGPRRDDGHPLIHAVKGRRGFSITPAARRQLDYRAQVILANVAADLQGFDQVLPIPSSSPFCAQFAQMVANVAGAPILDAAFLRKCTVGQVLAAVQANPPKVRPGLKSALNAQLHAWQGMDPAATYQAKDVDVGLRQFFAPFALNGAPPALAGQKVLIVDDVFATGSSLVCVREIVQNQLGASVSAVFYLSGV